MPVFPADELSDLIARILKAAGAQDGNAWIVADHLVLASLSGVDTHGIVHVSGYVDAIQKGEIQPTASPEVLKETAGSVFVTGNWSFGHVAAQFAMERAIEKAESREMAIAGLVELNHIGRLGHYTEMAAARGLISLVSVGGHGTEKPAAVPYGGREPLMHTNPVAVGFPGGEDPSMAFDFATTGMSGGKLDRYRQRGEALPEYCIVNRDGASTTDPEDIADGFMTAFGGHKGYAIMMATEFLGPIFTGADAFSDTKRGSVLLRHQGVSMIVFRADLFQSLAEFEGRAERMRKRTQAIKPADGHEEVRVPGDRAARARTVREREGIPVEDDVWQSIVDTAQSVGVEVG